MLANDGYIQHLKIKAKKTKVWFYCSKLWISLLFDATNSSANELPMHTHIHTHTERERERENGLEEEQIQKTKAKSDIVFLELLGLHCTMHIWLQLAIIHNTQNVQKFRKFIFSAHTHTKTNISLIQENIHIIQ